MDIKQVKDEKLTKSFKVTLPETEINQKVTERLGEIAPNVKISGFRPGKVPQEVLQKRYGDVAIKEVLEKELSEVGDLLIKKHGLRVAMSPQYDMQPYEKGKDFTLEITFSLLPDIKEVAFDKLSIDRYSVPFTQKALDESLNRLADRHYQTEPLASQRALKEGDVAVIDFEGALKGKTLPEATAKNYEILLGSKTFIEGFEEGLVGMQPGEEREITLTFPKDYHAPHLAGEDVTFKVRLHQVNKKVPATLDDAFATRLGFKDFKELSEKMKSQIVEEYENIAKQVLKYDLLEMLDEAYDIESPPRMIEQEFNAIAHQLVHDQTKSDTCGEGCELEGHEKYREEYYPIAERRVKLGLVLADVAHKNDLKVVPQDIEEEVYKRARQYPGQEKQIFTYYKENPQAVQSIQASLLEAKVLDYLLTKIKVENKEIPLDELRNMLDNKGKEKENGSKKSKKLETASPDKAAQKKAIKSK